MGLAGERGLGPLPADRGPVAFPPGSGNVLKVQQLLHICSEHFDSKEKEEDKDKKDKKEKEKKESSADMGAHQVGGGGGAASEGSPGSLWDWS